MGPLAWAFPKHLSKERKMKKTLILFFVIIVISAVSNQSQGAAAPAVFPYTVISVVKEANPRVVALAIEFEKDLPINWKLDNAFQVTAELSPVKSYSGDLIANSAIPRARRTITKAYTSRKAEIGKPSQGKFVIIEMDPEDYNASSWYFGFNPGIRQAIDYKENLRYEVKLLCELNYFKPDVPAGKMMKPGSVIETVKTDSTFEMKSTKIVNADQFIQGIYTTPDNPTIKEIGYNFYKPTTLSEGEKLPLVVFLHGSGQSHDYLNFPGDLMVDVKSPLLANQGGITWIENGPDKCFVLVPQMPARDTKDAAGMMAWQNSETRKLLLGLVNKVIAENAAIDTKRLYIAGLSMGGVGIWGIITDPNPAISQKFAAAIIISGMPKLFMPASTDSPDQKKAKLAEALAADYSNVKIPVWLFHCDTDPVVNRLGARVPFATLTGKATVNTNGDLVPAAGILKKNTRLMKYYAAKGKTSGKEVRYTEYQFGDGTNFRDLGMVTPMGHNSWEIAFKDKEMIDWLFFQKKSR